MIVLPQVLLLLRSVNWLPAATDTLPERAAGELACKVPPVMTLPPLKVFDPLVGLRTRLPPASVSGPVPPIVPLKVTAPARFTVVEPLKVTGPA